MPACVAHFVVLCETANALIKQEKGIGIFGAQPVKQKNLIQLPRPLALNENELATVDEADGELRHVRARATELSDKDDGISQYAYLGAASPDLGYYSDATEFVSDLFHYSLSGSFAIKLVECARQVKIRERERGEHSDLAERLMALALGYISHVSADIIIHPYVNILAGAYWSMPIKKIRKLASKPLSMHMMIELHQDSWLAYNYFGRKKLSTGWGKSWSDFVTNLFRAGVFQVRFKKADTIEVLKVFCGVFNDLYGKNLDAKAFHSACGRFHDALDLGYDYWIKGSGKIPYSPSINLVNYNTKRKKLVDHPYIWYLLKAIETSTDLCSKAIDYYDNKHVDFYLSDWNLDTGYRVVIDEHEGGIRIKYQHSWAHDYGLGPERPPEQEP